MARTKQKARVSTGGKCPRKSLAERFARNSGVKSDKQSMPRGRGGNRIPVFRGGAGQGWLFKFPTQHIPGYASPPYAAGHRGQMVRLGTDDAGREQLTAMAKKAANIFLRACDLEGAKAVLPQETHAKMRTLPAADEGSPSLDKVREMRIQMHHELLKVYAAKNSGIGLVPIFTCAMVGVGEGKVCGRGHWSSKDLPAPLTSTEANGGSLTNGPACTVPIPVEEWGKAVLKALEEARQKAVIRHEELYDGHDEYPEEELPDANYVDARLNGLVLSSNRRGGPDGMQAFGKKLLTTVRGAPGCATCPITWGTGLGGAVSGPDGGSVVPAVDFDRTSLTVQVFVMWAGNACKVSCPPSLSGKPHPLNPPDRLCVVWPRPAGASLVRHLTSVTRLPLAPPPTRPPLPTGARGADTFSTRGRQRQRPRQYVGAGSRSVRRTGFRAADSGDCLCHQRVSQACPCDLPCVLTTLLRGWQGPIVAQHLAATKQVVRDMLSGAGLPVADDGCQWPASGWADADREMTELQTTGCNEPEEPGAMYGAREINFAEYGVRGVVLKDFPPLPGSYGLRGAAEVLSSHGDADETRVSGKAVGFANVMNHERQVRLVLASGVADVEKFERTMCDAVWRMEGGLRGSQGKGGAGLVGVLVGNIASLGYETWESTPDNVKPCGGALRGTHEMSGSGLFGAGDLPLIKTQTPHDARLHHRYLTVLAEDLRQSLVVHLEAPEQGSEEGGAVWTMCVPGGPKVSSHRGCKEDRTGRKIVCVPSCKCGGLDNLGFPKSGDGFLNTDGAQVTGPNHPNFDRAGESQGDDYEVDVVSVGFPGECRRLGCAARACVKCALCGMRPVSDRGSCQRRRARSHRARQGGRTAAGIPVFRGESGGGTAPTDRARL